MLADSVFKVKGKPFFTIGAQAHNSSGYSLEELENVWKACELMEVNTCAIAISWERFEPVEGEFDLDLVEDIIKECRSRQLKLVFLWFGTWKNGNMKYVPGWVKSDRTRFPRVLTHDGYEISNLSSFSDVTLAADRNAFCRLIEKIKEVDFKEQTVLAVQIENEQGIVGRTIRDFGEKAQLQYESAVPQELIDKLKTASDREYIVRVWKECGAKEQGTWKELFGRFGDECLQAWSMAGYVDNIAAAGKEIYNLPMYTNVWLDNYGFDIPGINYPAGGAVTKNLAIYKWQTPHLDMICPDIYLTNQKDYMDVARTYTREDNPLYIPETGTEMPSALGAFRAIAECAMTGIHYFGAENVIDTDGSLKESAKPMHENFQCLNAVIPLLLKYRGTDKIHAVIQEEFSGEQKLFFDDWKGVARFGPIPHQGDYHHRVGEQPTDRGIGLIIQTAANEFFVCGIGFTLTLRKNPPFTVGMVPQQEAQQENFLEYLKVEEGKFDTAGNWQVTRIRNGDQSDIGIFVYPDVGAVRVVME
jgi:hypothetical protein